MNKNQKIMYITIGFFFFFFMSLILLHQVLSKEEKEKPKKMKATVISVLDGKVMVQNKDHMIYTFEMDTKDIDLGSLLAITYTGVLNEKKSLQINQVLQYETLSVSFDEDGIPTNYLDEGIFRDYYILAYQKLKELSLEEKIGQLLLVRYPEKEEFFSKSQFSGYVFYEKDFKDLTIKEVQKKMNDLQQISKIPFLTAVDEEGGEVVRVSSNPKLAGEKFLSPQELYQKGGMQEIAEDTKQKSILLKQLGLNMNLAPVVDVSTTPSDYIYKRSLGQDSETTAKYAKTVIENSKETGVSYTLKHFPGYGQNQDTHENSVEDERSYQELLQNDFPPFQAGIDAGAEVVLVGHQTVTQIDSSQAASLSPSIHNLLRNQLKFTGIVMTDDLGMGAVSKVSDVYVKALLAGNDLLLVTDYETAKKDILKAVEEGRIGEELINQLAFRVLAFKYYKGLLFEIVK